MNSKRNRDDMDDDSQNENKSKDTNGERSVPLSSKQSSNDIGTRDTKDKIHVGDTDDDQDSDALDDDNDDDEDDDEKKGRGSAKNYELTKTFDDYPSATK